MSFFLVVAMLFGILTILPISASAEAGDTFTDSQGLTYTVNSDNTTVSVTGFDKSTTEVTIPGQIENGDTTYTVTTIGSDAFKTCSDLQSVELNEGIETISSSAFKDCTNLTEIVFPKSMLTIKTSAFSDCTALRSVEFNSDLELGTWSFRNCTNLEKVTCNSFNTQLKAAAFTGASKFTIYGYEGSSAETFANEKSYEFEKITVDPTVLNNPLEDAKAKSEIMYTADSYKTLADAIKKAEDILKQEKPSDADILNCIKELNDAINSLVLDNTTNDGFTWQTIDEGKAIEIIGVEKQVGSELTIPSEIKDLPVTSIGTSAFFNVNYANIIIPDSVTIIKKQAFNVGVLIKKITFGENSRLETIEDEAFVVDKSVETDKMEEISLPASLKTIGSNAFGQRKNLTKVIVNSKDVEFGNNVFEGNQKLTIVGYENSTAQAYADANGHRFSYLGMDLTELKALISQAEAMSPQTDALKTAIREANKFVAQYEVNGMGSPSDLANCIKALKEAMGIQDESTTQTEPTTVETEPTTNATEPTTDVTEPTSSPEPVYETVLLGDADGNGIVNIKDVTYIQLYLARLLNQSVNPIYLNCCDVDGDGEPNIKDATQLQLWCAKFNVDYEIGKLVQREVTPGSTPTTPTDPTTATQPDSTTATENPTTATENPTTATDPPTIDPNSVRFYVPNAVGWLTDLGGSMWLYNDDTKEFKRMMYDDENATFYFDIPKEWSNLSIYRSRYETDETTFDINNKWNEETQTGEILNEWTGLGSRGSHDCYYITADGKGYYTSYESTKEDDYMKTVYFDNSVTKWSTVYIYGWGNSGLAEVGKAMTHIEGTDIWSYTFVDPYIPAYGVEQFLFVNKQTSKADSASWSGASQTVDQAIEQGKNLFVPSSATGTSITGTWDVYTPAE